MKSKFIVLLMAITFGLTFSSFRPVEKKTETALVTSILQADYPVPGTSYSLHFEYNPGDGSTVIRVGLSSTYYDCIWSGTVDYSGGLLVVNVEVYSNYGYAACNQSLTPY